MEFDIARARSPGFIRRLAAMVYDLILLFGMLLLAVTLVVLPYEGLTGSEFPNKGWIYHLHQLYLLCIVVGFHIFFWVRAGQTLGMRAWRFRLFRDDGRSLSVADAFKRFAWATATLAPIGLLWIPFDSERLGLYDRLSHTRPVMLKKGS